MVHFLVQGCHRRFSTRKRRSTTVNDGFSGEIKLKNYPDGGGCHHVVQADSSCEAIRIKYRDVAYRPFTNNFSDGPEHCGAQHFRFSWENNGFRVTPRRCDCFGDGCSFTGKNNDYVFGEYIYNGEVIDRSRLLGPDDFIINSNKFTFYSVSWETIGVFPRPYFGGHVILNWECVEHQETTTTTTTTEITTTTTYATTT